MTKFAIVFSVFILTHLSSAIAQEEGDPIAAVVQSQTIQQRVQAVTSNSNAADCAPPGAAVPAGPAKCNEGVNRAGPLQIQTSDFAKGCTVMVVPSAFKPPYRQIEVSQRGVVQFFDDFGGKSTGTHTFYFFPRKTVPGSQVVAGQLVVTTSSGAKLSFDPNHFQTTSSPPLPPNGSWNSNTLILDTGYGRGQPADVTPSLSSTFIDPSGKRCSVQNSEIFSYKNKYDPDIKSDADLWPFLKRRCPNLALPKLN